MLPSTKTRAYLAHNVETMLENVSAIRQRNKIDSDDLFGGYEEQTSESVIPWKDPTLFPTDLEVLLLEKESLGIYVSGNPLREYQEMQQWVREVTFMDDIHLVIIDKVKKIFTKSNHMMFALALSTLKEPVEGIIFPKLAPIYSNMLEEKDIYWIKGRISQKKKKKPAAPQVNEDGEPIESDGNEIKEYDELPKLIVDAVVKFEEGPIPLVEDATSLAVNRIEMINGIDWKLLKSQPTRFGNDDEKQTDTNKNETTSEKSVQKVILKKELGAQRLKNIHQSISRSHQPGTQEIELWVESNGEMKKVKGPLWINSDVVSDLV
jgi:DNA polymerase-3 subunit alpha